MSEKRRTIPVALKLRAINEYDAGATERSVCAKYGIDRGQLYTWRQNYKAGRYTLDNAVAVSKQPLAYFLVKGTFFVTFEEAQRAALTLNAPIDKFVLDRTYKPVVRWE